jgi:hypothetical protein
MNTGFRPIPATTPVDAAADIMLRRGECQSFGQAVARIRWQRRRAKYGATEINQADRDARARVESPRHYRAPYADHE